MSDVKLHAECKWDWRRPLDGTEIRFFFDEWRAISSRTADEPLKPSVSESCSCAAGKMLMAFLMEADGDLKLLILFVLESSAMLLSEHGHDAHR